MLVRYGMTLNLGPEAMKAWSQNLGHADVLTDAGAETVIRRWSDLKGVIAALSAWSEDA